MITFIKKLITRDRTYKSLSLTDLHRIKNDTGIRPEHRSEAEALIADKQISHNYWTRIIASAGLVISLISLIWQIAKEITRG